MDDTEEYVSPRCGVCGRRKGPSFLLWREEDGIHSNHDGWQQVGERHYCPRCVGKLLGKAAS